MKVNKYFIIICFLLTILGHNISAQNTATKSLRELLPTIERQYKVVFTFADENINGVFVTIPNKSLDLETCLLGIEKQTSLKFNRLDSRYITIQREYEISISGYIIDQSTGEPLVGAYISSGNKFALSGDNGYFFITLYNKKNSPLSLSYTGYKPLYIDKYHNIENAKTYALIPDVQDLKEVVVNYIAKGLVKQQDASIQMNVKKLEVLPGLSEPDVLHAVQVLPGIQSINETVSDINTRGGTNDQNLVLWDGVKMYQTGHFFGLISAFNSKLIHKTTIVKNGTRAALGEGVSGTIDMRQQDYLVKDLKVSAGVNMLSSDIILKTPITNKLSLIFGARHSINNIVLSPTYKSYYKRAFENTEVLLNKEGKDKEVENYQNFSFYDLNAKLLYDISDKDKLRLSVLNINNNIEYEERAFIQNSLYKKNSSLSQSSTLSNLNYTRSWTQNNSIQLSAYMSNYYLDGTNVSILENRTHIQKNDVIDWGVKLNSKNKINKTITIHNGYQFNEIGIRNQDNILKPNYSRDVKDVLRIHSLYTEAGFKDLFKRLYIRTGIRTNYYTKFRKFSIEPRIVLNYKIIKHLSIEALAEKKSQHTTQLIDYQTDFLGVEKRKWALSNNQSIPLIKSFQYSLGLQYNNNNFLATLEVYKKRIRGIITPSQGFQNEDQFIYSTGKYDAEGVELLLNKRFDKYNIWINYAFAHNNYFFHEYTPSSFPNNLDIRHTLSLGGSYNTKHIELSCGFNYRTGKPYTKPSSLILNDIKEIEYEKANSSRLEDYVRLDLSAKYKFNIKKIKVEFGFSLWNILDRKNVINIFYRKNTDNIIEKVTQNALGLTPHISLRIRL